MTTFKAIDQTAASADKPYSAALAQGSRNNVIASRDNRGRGMCKVYETRVDGGGDPINTPRMVGTYAWEDDEKRVHTMIPFIYVRTRPEYTQIEVTAVGDQVVALGTHTAVVITMRDAMGGVFPGLDDVDNMPNASTAGQSVGTDVEVSFTGSGALTLPANEGDTFMVFYCHKSSLSGSISEITDASATVAVDINAAPENERLSMGGNIVKYNSDTPHSEVSQRPTFALGLNDSTGKNSWPSNDGPSARQAIFVDDDSTDFIGIYIYPPYKFGFRSGFDPALHLMKKDLSYFDLKSVNIVESTIRPFAFDSALNAGKPAAVEIHSQTVVEAEKVALLHTPVFHCGGSVAPTPDIILTSARGVINKLHHWSEYTAAWQTIGACPVRPHGEHKTYGEQQQTRVGYRVVGVIALTSGVGYNDPRGIVHFEETAQGNSLRLSVRLRLTDRDGSTNEVLGGEDAHGFIPANTFAVGQSATLGHGNFSPVGYLLRMHHIVEYDSQAVNNLVSHSLLGQFPEDVWSLGHYLYFDADIVDTTDIETPIGTVPARLLSVQVLGNAADVPSEPTFGSDSLIPTSNVHLLTWTVVGKSVSRPGLVGEVSV